MRAFSVAAIIVPVAVFVTAASAAGAQDDVERLFAQQCAMCHGESGAGDGTAAVAMNLEPASFTDSVFQQSRTDEQLANAISAGQGTAMPSYGERLTAEQIAALVSYIRRLGRGDR